MIDPNDFTYDLPASVGSLKAYLRNWDFDDTEEGKTDVKLIPQESATCTDDQMAAFDTHMYASEEQANKQITGMQCLEGVGVRGNSDQIKGTEFVLRLEVNQATGTVVDYRSAADVLKGKAIVFQVNEMLLNPEKFEEPVSHRSRFFYVPI